MSLKSALVAYQQEKKEKGIVERIEAMLTQQKLLLAIADNEKCNTGGKPTGNKPSKEWQPDILTKGGISYYTLNDKKHKVSVCNNDNDVVLKYWFKNALGVKVSVSTKTLKEAQAVVNDIYGVSKDGKSKYSVSASKI